MSGAFDAVGSFLGFGGDDSVKDAGKAEVAGIRDQIAYLEGAEERAREDVAPFRQLGLDSVDAFSRLLTPEGRAEYLEADPGFDVALERTQDSLTQSAAANGLSQSGGLVDELFKSYLSLGDSYINSQFNRLLQPVTIGANASTGTAANTINVGSQIGNSFANIGSTNAGSILGQQNAQANFGNNLLGLTSMAFGFSDEDLKENIELIDQTEDGLNVYQFNYKGTKAKYTGHLAHEVLEVDPEAVQVGPGGYLVVSNKYAPMRVA